MIFFLLFAACATGQINSQSHKLSILLPANIPSEKVEVRYLLYGSFGANGGYVTPKPDSPVVEIQLSTEGKTANGIKLFAWAPGCQIATYDISVHDLDVQELYTCYPVPTVVLQGKIADTSLLQQQAVEIRVDYLAEWACEFFGLPDCMVPQISLRTAKIDADGHFETELPDFAHDPISSGSKLPSSFDFVLREVNTWNLITLLDPESKVLRSAGSGLTPASSYPQSVVFVPRKTN